ncbi:sensor domain-containing diguanylate cyclase [bacterium]|nr:sensor domain-containing diguanylate cyclase [candidate division CSSED10-310 bacterium]
MREKYVLSIFEPLFSEQIQNVLKAAKIEFRICNPDELHLEPSGQRNVVIVSAQSFSPGVLKQLEKFKKGHPLHAIVGIVEDSKPSEWLVSEPHIFESIIQLPADPMFLQLALSNANEVSKIECSISETRKRINVIEEQLEMFVKVGRAIASSLELNQVLTSIMNIAGGLLKSEAWSLGLTDPETGDLVFEAARGDFGGQVRGMRLPQGTGVIGWVAQHGEPLIVADTSKDTRHFKEVDRDVGFESRSILCLPLIAKSKVLGAIEFINKIGGQQFTVDDIEDVRVFVDLAAVSIENALLYRKVAQLSQRDELTGLYNQRTLVKLLNDQMQHAKESGQSLAYLFLDLDHFKRINDRHGHLMGRQTLKEIGQLLEEISSGDVIIGRYGGDEFWVIMPAAHQDDAMRLAEIIRSTIENHTFLQDQGLDIHLTVSVGVALYPDQAHSFDELAKMADQALYHAKRIRNKVLCMNKKNEI